MNVRRHAQRRHRAATANASRARVLRMRRLLRHARGIFALARELDAAAQLALAPVVSRAAPPRTGQLWPPRRPGLVVGGRWGDWQPSVPYAPYVERGTGPLGPLEVAGEVYARLGQAEYDALLHGLGLTEHQAATLDELELGT